MRGVVEAHAQGAPNKNIFPVFMFSQNLASGLAAAHQKRHERTPESMRVGASSAAHMTNSTQATSRVRWVAGSARRERREKSSNLGSEGAVYRVMNHSCGEVVSSAFLSEVRKDLGNVRSTSEVVY